MSQADVCTSFGGTAVVGDVVYVPCTDGGAGGSDRRRRDDARAVARRDSIAGSPVVGGGRIWTVDQHAGMLHRARPDTGKALQQVEIGATSRFATPALYGKYVLVGTLAGLAVVVHLLSSAGCGFSFSAAVRASTRCAWRSRTIPPSPR